MSLLFDEFIDFLHFPASSFPRGSVSVDDGNMTHFVADNLEYKIKIASPATRKGT